MTARRWKVHAGAVAQTDFRAIIDWTNERFGPEQAHSYGAILVDALDALGGGPTALGVKARPDIGPNLYTLHAARQGHRARHFILFRTVTGHHRIEVLRILHDAMDVARHVPHAERD